jgi:moderate conductance mechanosensitive channel
MNFDNLNFFNIENIWLSLIRIAVIILVLVVIIIVVRIVSTRLKRYAAKNIPDNKVDIRKRTYTVNSVISNFIIVTSVFIALLIIAGELNIQITPILASAGVLGIVIGFGAQSLIKDIINGLFILFEQQYQIDDIITIGEVSGVVERVSLRTTVLRDLEGIVHYIPNGEIKTVGNRTQGWARALIEVGVHYSENVDNVTKVLQEVFDEILKDKDYKGFILERPTILGNGGIDDLADSAVMFKIICKVVPPHQWDIARQLRKRIKKKFDEKGIEIPFPCNNVYMRSES